LANQSRSDHICRGVLTPQCLLILLAASISLGPRILAQTPSAAHVVILHAARLLDIEGGRIVAPGEVRVEGETIVAASATRR
jgi:hypothetical protein